MKFIFLIFIYISLYSNEIKIASYNVENLFDLKYSGTEYKEYKPNSKYWNKYSLNTKLSNLTKVIKDLNADILSLQEIESQYALNLLLQRNKSYRYSYFLKKNTSAIGLAIISKYPIISNERINVNKYSKYSRPILKSTIKINNENIIIYTNHWKSKRTKESTRVPYAQALIKDIKYLSKNDKYLIVGDLNSNYNEFVSFKSNKKLNDTYGITGINQVLNTSYKGNLLKKIDLNKKQYLHYNLWLELNDNNRFSSFYKGSKNTPDNIIISKALLNNKGLNYLNNSFSVFKPKYLYSNKINRWNIKKRTGYSDHLPIYCILSSKKQKTITKPSISNKRNIDYLYDIQTLNKSIELKNVTVIFKRKNRTIIKNKNSRAIMIYSKNNKLEFGFSYDLLINKIDTYYGLKEITQYKLLKKLNYNSNHNKLYLAINDINITDNRYQNEVIKNIIVTYSNNNYILLKNIKINIYFQKNIKKPKKDTKILIKYAHVSVYNNKVQLVIYNQNDFEVL